MSGEASSWGASRRSFQSSANVAKAYENELVERTAASQRANDVAFFLTVEEKEKLLVGIDLTNGKEVGKIPMPEKEPNFMVDAVARRVYHFHDNKIVKAYDF